MFLYQVPRTASLVTTALFLILFCSIECHDFEPLLIHSVIEDTFSCHKNPGMAVSVVKDGKVIFSRGYGVTDLTSQGAVSSDTLFGIASVSKSFAATLLVKLLSEKNISVDSKVKDFLGNKFKMPDEVRTEETTFADLMAHKTGVPANNWIRFDNNLTRENLVERMRDLSAPYQFRVKFIYSNIMYGLVTYLAEKLGADTWENLVRKQLYEPLGMTRSTFATVADLSRPDLAKAYVQDKSGELNRVSQEFTRRWSMLAGSGAVISSANDMSKWMNFHLSDGKNAKEVQVMQREDMDEIHKPRFKIGSVSSKDTRKPTFPVTSSSNMYAFGFRRGFYRGYERMSHTGSTNGMRSMMSLLPGVNVGVFTVMTGKDDDYVYRVPLHMYLMDSALGFHPWLNSTTICSYPAPWKTPKKSSRRSKRAASRKRTRPLTAYVGTYYNKAYGHLTVRYYSKYGSLMMTYGWGKWRLYRRNSSSGDSFYGSGRGYNTLYGVSPIDFRSDPNNKSRIKDIKAIGFESKAPPIFVKL